MAQNIRSFCALLILLCAYYSAALNDITDLCLDKCAPHPDIQARWHCLRICQASLRDIVRDDVIARHGLSSSSSSRRRRRSIDEEFVPEWVGGGAMGVSEGNQGSSGKGGALSSQGTLVRVLNIGNLPNSYESFENSQTVSANKRNNRVNNKPSFARIGKSFWRIPENDEKRAASRSFARVGKAIPLNDQEDAFIFEPLFDEEQIDYLTSEKRAGLGSYVRIGRSNSPDERENEKRNGFDAQPAYYDDSEFAEKKSKSIGSSKSFARVGRDPEVPVPKYTDNRGRTVGARSFVRIGKKYEETEEEKLGAVNVVEVKEPVSVGRLGKRDTLSAAVVSKESSV